MPAYKDEDRGTWYVSFHYSDYTGINRRKMKRGFKTKREALEYERQFKERGLYGRFANEMPGLVAYRLNDILAMQYHRRSAEDFAEHINGLRKTDLAIRHGQFILMQPPQGLRPGRRGQRKGQRHRQQERKVFVHNLF